jgi:tRNA nucleotidyltransferase (CCA-adding enzyme)
MLGSPTGEPDLEVFGLPVRELERALRPLGKVRRIGRAFPVLRIGSLPLEVALPRRESKTGPGHLGFEVVVDPHMSFKEAARRRDLTLNAMGLDPLTGELFDPYGGRRDLAAGVMRATDSRTFAEDPLRGLRVAAFASRFSFTADAELERLCSELDLSELSPERIFDELGKLLHGKEPSRGLRLLATTGLLRFLPEVDALRGVPQDPGWHPEGDVFEHTLLALDRAAERAPEEPEARRILLFATLCHDFGKPATTRERRGRITAYAHDAAGAPLARRFLEALRAPRAVTDAVEALTHRHLAPAFYPRQGAKRAAYRRLAREMAAAGTTLDMLLLVATADQLGRTTKNAIARRFPEGEVFRERAEAAGVLRGPPLDAVSGRHVLARNIPPGKEVGRILDRSRQLQDESGETDPETILDRVIPEETP